MAIQLNDRDLLIFKLIDEHRVLLEKHISWFISGDDKPVLIRDRLRKLFYLDYLLCHRHGTKLPWWTTPTKPLVYMLSPMSRSLAGAVEDEVDLFDSNIQRHYLEVANLRMLGMMDQKDGLLSNFEWKTVRTDGQKTAIDATMSFQNNGRNLKIGIINHPDATTELIACLDESAKDNDAILIVCRDDAHLQSLQKSIAQSGSQSSRKCIFATHHELYRAGLIKAQLLNCEGKAVEMFSIPTAAAAAPWATAIPATISA
ncbi:MAG TPA: hypothetical protein V6D17_20585 [Candidatus Obscuribacterales bacterium]